eukprot:12309635-Alexandrium_andersonii.AAC.1
MENITRLSCQLGHSSSKATVYKNSGALLMWQCGVPVGTAVDDRTLPETPGSGWCCRGRALSCVCSYGLAHTWQLSLRMPVPREPGSCAGHATTFEQKCYPQLELLAITLERWRRT